MFQLWHLDSLRTAYGGSGLSGDYVYHWLAQGLILACFWPPALWLGRRIVQRTSWPLVACLPLAWLTFEFVRRQATAIFDGAGYPLGQLGLSQGNLYWMQIADLGGISAVTLLVAVVNGAIVDLFTLRRPAAVGSIVAGAIAVSFSLLYGSWRLAQKVDSAGPTVGLLPGFATGFVYRKHDKPIPDLMLSTEGAGVTLAEDHDNDDLLDLYHRFTCEQGTSLVVNGTRQTSDGRFFNSTFFFDTSGYVGCYDKMMLVLFTERTPDSFVPFFRSGFRGLTPGTKCPVFEVGGQRIAATICYDVCFSKPYQHAMCGHPDFFVLSGSERYDHTGRVAALLLRFAQYRAIECRRAIVRAAADGHSGVIDGSGRFVRNVPPGFFEPMAVGHVPCDGRLALFSRVARHLGDWLGAASALLTMLTIVMYRSGVASTSPESAAG